MELTPAAPAHAFSIPPCAGQRIRSRDRYIPQTHQEIRPPVHGANAGYGELLHQKRVLRLSPIRLKWQAFLSPSVSLSPGHVVGVSSDNWQAIPFHHANRLAARRSWTGRSRPSFQLVTATEEGAARNSLPEQQGTEQRSKHPVISAPRSRSLGSTSANVDVILHDQFEELEGVRPRYSCVVRNSLAAPTPYNQSWEWQKQALSRLASSPDNLAETDVMLLTQHDAVFTLGTGSTLDNLRFDPDDAPFDVVRTERGGEVTYHGPGQIVMYPIMNLRRYRQDIHWYLRALEEIVIRTLAKLGLQGERIEGLTGVWVAGHKVAAVGVRVKRWITMHGLSLNVRPDLDHFKHIVPCGIGDRPVSSLEELCAGSEKDVSMERVGALLVESFEDVFGVYATEPPSKLEGENAE